MNSSSRRVSRLPYLRVFLLTVTVIQPALAKESWHTFHNCYYVPNPANDGDSFHVRVDGKEYIFRLYFVDAPETDKRVPERLEEQAKYFHTSVSKTLEIGAEAERFTRHELIHPFTVRTCFQNARGRSRLPRYFAVVEAGRSDLAESLVANGLARVYGAASHAPQTNSTWVEWHKLQGLERKAKAERIGGWGVTSGRLSRRAATQPPTTTESFESAFHLSPVPATASISRNSANGVKLNINTATAEELETIRGVGPVLAARIIAARPFQSADDLQKVKGIKDKRYAELRPNFE